MKIYIVMVDMDGTMRSSCDTPKAAFKTKKEAQNYIKENNRLGYSVEIKEVEYHV